MQWVLPEQLKEQRIIELGHYPDSSHVCRFYDAYLGDGFGFFSMTGYGKSRLFANILIALAKSRNIIIFDYNGEHKNLKYVNFGNKDAMFGSIPDLVYIDNFGFKLSDFTNPFDWKMLGMGDNAAEICASKAKMIIYHKNDFRVFREMIEEIQVKKNDEVWHGTRKSILSKLSRIEKCFIKGKCVDITDADLNMVRQQGVPYYISNWKRFFRKHRHICLNLRSGASPAKAQLFAGKIMNELRGITNEIYDCLKEKHKDGVKIMMVTQNPQQLHDTAFDEIKRFFVGKLQNVKGHSKLDEIFRASIALKYNYFDDYREFLHYSATYGVSEVFIPFDSLCYYEKRK